MLCLNINKILYKDILLFYFRHNSAKYAKCLKSYTKAYFYSSTLRIRVSNMLMRLLMHFPTRKNETDKERAQFTFIWLSGEATDQLPLGKESDKLNSKT